MATSDDVGLYATYLASEYGLRITSHERSPEKNAAVGGAKNSDHLTGLAVDLAGDPKKMEALAQFARANMGPGRMFRWVGWGDAGHKDHVHLSFNADADVSNTKLYPAGSAPAAAAEGGAAVAAQMEEDDLPPDASPEQIEAYIREHYPQYAPFLANEEIRRIITRPDIDDLDALEVESLIRATNYWQTHGPESRAFDALLGTEPIKAGQVIDTAKVILNQTLSAQGVHLDDTQLGEVAKKAIRAGWISVDTGQIANPQMIQQFVAFTVGLAGGNGLPVGETGAVADKLFATARNYLVPVTRSDAEQWALKMTAGTASEEQYLAWLQSLARGRFAGQEDLVAAIDSGVTPGDFFRAHQRAVAETLELSPEQIDLADPKWSWITETVDEKGKRRAPTLSEITLAARQRPEFEGTNAYRQGIASVGMGLFRFITGQRS